MIRTPAMPIIAVVTALLLTIAPTEPSTAASSNENANEPIIATIVGDEKVVEFANSASVTELIESAREMYVAGNVRVSEMLYKRVLIREPENVAALLELSVIYESMERLEYAKGLLTRASIIRPHDQDIIDRMTTVVARLSENLDREVDSLFAEKRYEEAIPKLAVLLAAQPEDADLYYKKAHCYLALGRPKAALQEIDKAIGLHRTDTYSKFKERVHTVLRQQRVRTLKLAARRALARHTPTGDKQALKHVAEIIDLEPDNSWAKTHFVQLTDALEPQTKTTAWQSRISDLWSELKTASRPLISGSIDISTIMSEHLTLLLAVLALLLLLGSPLTHVMIRGFSPRQALSGQLENFTIHEILTLIHTHQCTGALKLKLKGTRGTIFFGKGEVYHSRTRGAQGRKALGQLLGRAYKGNFVFVDGLSSKHKTIDIPLSLILMELPERRSGVAGGMLRRQSRMKALLENRS